MKCSYQVIIGLRTILSYRCTTKTTL